MAVAGEELERPDSERTSALRRLLSMWLALRCIFKNVKLIEARWTGSIFILFQLKHLKNVLATFMSMCFTTQVLVPLQHISLKDITGSVAFMRHRDKTGKRQTSPDPYSFFLLVGLCDLASNLLASPTTSKISWLFLG